MTTPSGKGYILWTYRPYEGWWDTVEADTYEEILEAREKHLKGLGNNKEDTKITSGEIDDDAQR